MGSRLLLFDQFASGAIHAANIVSFSDQNAIDYVRSTALNIADLANQTFSPIGIDSWDIIEADAQEIEDGLSASELARSSLWLNSRISNSLPGDISRIWFNLRVDLHDLREGWDVWTDWYEDRLAGKRPRWKDVEIFRVTLNEEADWEKGPAHVNALIKAKIAEKRDEERQKRETKNISRPIKPSLVEEEARISPILVERVQRFGDELAKMSRPYVPEQKRREISPALGGSYPTEIAIESNSNSSVLLVSSGVGKKKRVPRPKTSSGKAVLANKEVIIAQIAAVNWFIVDRVSQLRSNYGANDRDAIDTEIAELLNWNVKLDEIQTAIQTLVTTGDEQKIDTVTQAFRQAMIDFLKTQGKETIGLGTRSAIFATVLGVGALCGVAWPAALISGVIVGGKPVGSMIVSVWGKAKSAIDPALKQGKS